MRRLTCMRMSAKMTILFSVIAACMIAVNSVLATLSEIRNILLYEEDNLNAMASKIVAAFNTEHHRHGLCTGRLEAG